MGYAIYERRKLKEGEFTVVKIFYEPEELAQHFAAAGFAVEARKTANYFIYARGRRTNG